MTGFNSQDPFDEVLALILLAALASVTWITVILHFSGR